MSNLPNNNDEKIKVYPNEYITNITINRPNLRLLENDLYLENLFIDAVSGALDLSGLLDHDMLNDVTADQHHSQSHTIVSHSDTNATGTELNTLTDTSNADSLHTHSSFAHAATHVNGVDDIQLATNSQKGLATSAQVIQQESVYSTVGSNSAQWDESAVFANFIPLSGSDQIAGSLTPNNTTTDLGSVSYPYRAVYVSGSSVHVGNEEVSESNIISWNAGVSGVSGDLSTHEADTANPHATDIENLGAGTLAELNSAVSNATLIDTGDGRLSDARTPTSHTIVSHSDTTGTGAQLNDLVSLQESSLHRHDWIVYHNTPTRISDSSFSVSDGAENQDKFKVGRPIRFKATAGSYRYGQISSYSSGTVSFFGAAMTTSYDDVVEIGPMAKVVQMDFFIAGTYGDGTTNFLLRDDMNTYTKWANGNAYLVKVAAVHKTVDSGTEPIISVFLGGSGALTAGITLGATGTWVYTGVNHPNPSYYQVQINEAIEISCLTAGGTGDAEDLTVTCTFVLE